MDKQGEEYTKSTGQAKMRRGQMAMGNAHASNKHFLPNNDEDEEPVGDGWLSLLIVTHTLQIEECL